MAASRDFSEALFVLDELGADLDQPTTDGATPAYIAAFHGFCEVLKALDDLKADLDKPMGDGATPAYIAAANNQVRCSGGGAGRHLQPLTMCSSHPTTTTRWRR